MKKHALLVGSFALGALALVVATVLWLSGNSLFRKQTLANIYFQGGVAGLYVGAPVTFRGVPVGQVEDIGIEVDQRSLDARIPVRIRLNPDSVRFGSADGQAPPSLETLVKRGLRARLVAQSFVTGQKLIDLDFIEEAPPPPQARGSRYPEIPAVRDRFEALFDQVAQLPLRETVQDLRATLQVLNATLAESRDTVQSARQALDDVAKQASGLASEGQRTLRATTAAMDELRQGAAASLASANRLLEASRETVTAAQPELQATLRSARAAADTAEQAMRRVNELAEPGAPLRADLDGAVRDLSQAARSLRDFSELIEEQPNAVIFGRRRE
ncbi:MlaD family protein [Azohydromonas caseinilytica]|uniref:MCE family protein n=1 Tax=Azohydromonas caseinilytica TaxID=2728836 RepID=A0A848FCF7_9BURK|nr:MlaD family protein [Azohydromonas caseinilytica]NML15860.1 MCE family protein [Azohydromonas caseinilytica]